MSPRTLTVQKTTPANDALVTTRSEQQRSRGQAEETKPGEQTDARDAKVEHVVGNRRQVSSTGGRQGGQVGGRPGWRQEIRQVMTAESLAEMQ